MGENKPPPDEVTSQLLGKLSELANLHEQCRTAVLHSSIGSPELIEALKRLSPRQLVELDMIGQAVRVHIIFTH